MKFTFPSHRKHKLVLHLQNGVWLVLFFVFFHFSLNATTGRYRAVINYDPSTNITIGWDQIDGKKPVLYYGYEDGGSNPLNYPFFTTPNRVILAKGMCNTFVNLTALIPGKKVFFIIKDENSVSKRYWFETCPAQTEKISLIAGGDSRNNRDPRRNANLLVSKLRPNAVLFGGDMTDDDTEQEWKMWLDDWQLTINKDGRISPLIPARGNHEADNQVLQDIFNIPYTGNYSAISFAGDFIRVYTLNSLSSVQGYQTDFLQADAVQNNHVNWKIAQYHFPIRPHFSGKIDAIHEYVSWAPIFQKHRFDLVIECDAHTVKTTYPIVPSLSINSEDGFVRDDENGTIYTGEGCWGAPLRKNDDNRSWTMASGKFNQFKWIIFSNDTMELRTIEVENAEMVGGVNQENRFTPPKNLCVWERNTGKTVLRHKRVEELYKEKNTNTLVIPITHPQNDGLILPDSSFDSRTSSIPMGKPETHTFLRFTDINIPQYAVIKNAYIRFASDETSRSEIMKIVVFQDENPPLFRDTETISQNTTFANRQITWITNEWNTEDFSWRCFCRPLKNWIDSTPNLSPLIQDLVSLPRWKKGNAILFFISGKGKKSTIAFESNFKWAPQLIIEYETNSQLSLKKIQKDSDSPLIYEFLIDADSKIEISKGLRNDFEW